MPFLRSASKKATKDESAKKNTVKQESSQQTTDQMKRAAEDGEGHRPADSGTKRLQTEYEQEVRKRLNQVEVELGKVTAKLDKIEAITLDLGFSSQPPQDRYVTLVKEHGLELDKDVLTKQREMIQRELQVCIDKKERDDDDVYSTLFDSYTTANNRKESNLDAYKREIAPLYGVTLPPPTLSVESSPPAMTSLTFEEFQGMLDRIKMVPEITTNRPEQQASLLGAFNRPDVQWPIVRRGQQWTIDFELMPSLLSSSESDIRPGARVVLRELETNPAPFHLMLAVSGSGKTSVFADVARTHFVIYLQCTPIDEKYDVRRSRGYDHGFVSVLKMYDATKHHDIRENTATAERLFTLEILCRIAQLYQLANIVGFDSLKPFDFYIHQRNLGDEWLEKLREGLTTLSEVACKKLIREMREKLDGLCERNRARLVIAVDEIEAAAKSFVNQFDRKKRKKKGILSPLVSAISSLQPAGRFQVVFTGTASSFDRADTLKSAINKTGSLHTYSNFIPSMFPNITKEACIRMLSRLNLDESVVQLSRLREDTEYDPNWDINPLLTTDPVEDVFNYAIIGSRFRTLTRIIHNIMSERHNDADVDDPQMRHLILKRATIASVTSMLTDLVNHFNECSEEREKPSDVRLLNELLARLWTGLQLNGGRMAVTTSSENVDLMKLAIGNFAGEANLQFYSVTERLVALALRRYFDQTGEPRPMEPLYTAAVDAFRKFRATHGNIPTRGNLLEHVVFHALGRTEFQNVMVSELPFVKDALKSRVQDGIKWWTTTQFRSLAVQYHHQLENGKSTADFLDSDAALGVVFSPETVTRFDAALMLDRGHAMVFAITIWNEQVPNEKVLSQIRSTDMAKAYFLANGEAVNKNAAAQRADWVRHGLDKVRAVRVHLALPEFNRELAQSYPIEHKEDLAVHLDLSSCQLLFGKDDDLIALLKIATTKT